MIKKKPEYPELGASKLKNRLNYIVMYLVFAMGGVPFFSVPKEMKLYVFLIIAGLFFKYSKKIDNSIIIVTLFFALIFYIQKIAFGGGTFVNFGLIFLIVAAPYFALKFVGHSFYKYYINITYFFAVIGLVFYTLSVLSPAFYNFTGRLAPMLGTDPTGVVQESFIFYTYERDLSTFLRSPGPFWEPGAYATFLSIALIFHIIETRSLTNKKSLVFIIAMITTFSTAGFITLFLIILSSVIALNIRNKRYYYWALPFILVAAVYSYDKFDFLGQKIEYQYGTQMEKSLDHQNAGRFLAARKSLTSISRYPITGRGLVAQTAAEEDSDEDGAYGFIDLAARIGLIGFVLYFTFLWKGFEWLCQINKTSRLFARLAVISLLGVLFAQGVYFRPIFFMIIYLPIVLRFSPLSRVNLLKNTAASIK
ncbi:MAG: O-antigen ligase family protein [Bacteroidales bacterium]|nr:O-antigen ligase family protein [Bacteroidales bacterium]